MAKVEKAVKRMACAACKVLGQHHAKTRHGVARFRCPKCRKTFSEHRELTLGEMYLTLESLVACTHSTIREGDTNPIRHS